MVTTVIVRVFLVSKNPIAGLADSSEFSVAHGLYLLYGHNALVNFFASRYRIRRGASS